MSDSSPQSGAADDENTPDAEQPDADQEVFVNRAARRGKAKGGANPAAFTKGKSPVGRGAVQSPRQYGNRRSG